MPKVTVPSVPADLKFSRRVAYCFIEVALPEDVDYSLVVIGQSRHCQGQTMLVGPILYFAAYRLPK